jgi:translation initiation factor IF-2
MLIKYRVHEVAKDLGVSGKEILEILKDILGVERKTMTALTENELNVIFEYYTQKFAFENFESYFAKRVCFSEKLAEQDIEKILAEYKNRIDKSGKKKKDDIFAKEKTVKKSEEPAEQRTEDIIVSSEKIENKEQKIINTRAAETENVNIEKYSEKYDKIASENTRKNQFKGFEKKQKFVQRAQKNKKSKKRETESERLARIARERKIRPMTISVPEEITVGELALKLKARSSEVIKKLISLGTMVSLNDLVDFDTASLVAFEFHAKVEKEIIRTIEEIAIDESRDPEESLRPRPPVVVVMGHVDHGKTSLLDKIRKTNVASGEQGGITQKIGAYKTEINKRSITFLDTPGHEAFTAMRARGAQATDVAILVVAADDGVMPQTVEAINHAKDASLSIIVAINKIDKPGADLNRIKQQLTEYGIVCEEWGGDVPCVPVSAKKGTGLKDLLEIVVLTADLKELKANPNRNACGIVIEAKLDKGKGTVATVLVSKGILKNGDVVVAGTSVGRVRLMFDDKGKRVKLAMPSDPVEIVGLDVPPNGGEPFSVISDEKLARRLVDQRQFVRENEKSDNFEKVDINNIFEQINEKSVKVLKVIIKADINGSVEAIRQAIEKSSTEKIKVRVIHGAVGAISESDIMFASASGAIIIGFNVRPGSSVSENARILGVHLKLYRVIYDCVNEINEMINGMLTPKFKETILGKAQCRKIFNVTGTGTVAGCYVSSGKMIKGSPVRLIRDGIVIAEDKILSLRRYKNDAKEVLQNYECGIVLERFGDFKINDIFEAFDLEKLDV